MKKKSKAQVYLEQVEKYDALIENKLIEQKRWQDLARSITANMDDDKVRSSGVKSKMALAVERCIDMEGEIAEAVEELIAKKKEIGKTIEQLYSPTEYRILHLRYIQHIRLIEIAEELGKEYSWVTTTHGRALKNVERLIK